MKKKMKLIIYIFISLIILFSVSTTTYAADTSMEGIITSADDFLNSGSMSDTHTQVNEESIKNTSNLIYNVLLTIGIIVAVIWGLVIAIKFITGAVEEKANIKETLIPYIVGCIIIFGAFSIWKLALIVLRPIE